MDDASGTVYAYGAPGAGVMASIETVPGSTSLAVGLATPFRAQAYDLFGNPSPGGPYVWTSTNGLGSVLPLNANGDQVVYIAGVYAGTDTLHVASGAFGANATVTVLPGVLDHVDVLPGVANVVAGTTISFNAAAKDRFGNTISGATFVWNATGVGTIDASGLLTASTQVGIGFVTATTGATTGTAIIAILPLARASVALQPAAVSVEAGSSLPLHAEGFDRYGNAISGLAFGWATTIGSIAPVETGSPTAVLAAGYLAGSGNLTVSSGGIPLVVRVVVTPGPLDRILVVMLVDGNRLEGPVDIPAGTNRTFVAETTDRFGNAIAHVPLLWSVTGGSGTITSNGAFTASTTVGAGSVIAMYATGMTGRQDVTIVPATPATVEIRLTSTSLAVDSNSVIVATVLDAYRNANPDGVVRWTTTGTGTILSLTPDGRSILYHAPITTTPASVQLTATIGAVTRTITLTIVAGPTDTIQVAMIVNGSPNENPVNIPAGSGQTFVADATDRFGNAITGATFTWAATGNIGTIDSAGVFTASTTPGSAYVTATQGGRTGRQAVTVVPGAPTTLEIDLPSTSVSVDSQALVVATARDAYANANPDGVVRWTTTGTGTILTLTPDGRSILYHAPITTTPASVQLTATIGAVTRTITLTIVAGPPVGIAIDAPGTTVAVGGILDFGAVVTDQFGNAVTGATVTWKATAGTINQQGVFTAPGQPGLVVITASTAGRESFLVVDVTSGGLEQFSRQATSATSLLFLVVALISIAAGVFVFVRYRETRRELEEMRKRGGGSGEP